MSSKAEKETIDRREFFKSLARKIGFIGLGVIAGSTALDVQSRNSSHSMLENQEGDYAGV